MISYKEVHHITVCVRDLEKAKDFYKKVLCLKEIARPGFPFDGAWFAVGESGQQLHLNRFDGQTLRRGGADLRDGHFALHINDYNEALAWLDHCEVTYDAIPDSVAGFPQIYITDPDENVIELNVQKK